MRGIFLAISLMMILVSCDGDKKVKETSPSNVYENSTQAREANQAAQLEQKEKLAAKAQSKSTTAKQENTNVKAEPIAVKGNFDKDIPDACTLITEAQVESVFGLPKGTVALKDGSSTQATKARACFFRWETDANPNAGILIQVQKNPIPEEYAEWPTLFIQSKIEGGEQTFDGSGISYKFEKWDEAGDAGCFSYEAGKYHWRIADDYVILLAFNTNNNKKSQMAAAKSISGIVMSNM